MLTDDGRLLSLSLAAWLEPLAFDAWRATQVTELLTDQVSRWAREQRWQVRREALSRVDLAARQGVGYLDLLCRRPDGVRIAIEIDRTDKVRSQSKLQHEARAGAIGLWLQWGVARWRPAPTGVHLVRLDVRRRHDAAQGRALYTRTPPSNLPAPDHSPALPPPTAPALVAPAPVVPPPAGGCTATTRTGQPCLIEPRPSGLCHVHDPAVQCGALTAKGRRCTVATGGGPCEHHQDADEPPALF
ncbi:hypothetical protein [Micromonospora sp. NPDC047074]|uniref:hypothetical protein n=1 Tax=Micromonospora sp. NPDC047074 TaxID=3154339 RepID=UPI0033C9D9CA